MIRIMGEISDPFDKAAIQGKTNGLSVARSAFAEVTPDSGKPARIVLDVVFNTPAGGNSFWGRMKGLVKANGGWITKHDCIDGVPCIIDERIEF